MSGNIDLPNIGKNGALRKLNIENNANQNKSASKTKVVHDKPSENDSIEFQPGMSLATSDFDPIKDMSMANEQVESSKSLILQQTNTALQAQANVTPQFVFSLLS
jgi:flagellin-like hook-associated protein FlgL